LEELEKRGRAWLESWLDQTFGRVGEEREGVELERRRREKSSRSLERERMKEMRYFVPKTN
jgi:hypothetical protein